MKPIEVARRFVQERVPSHGIFAPVATGLLGVAVISGCAVPQNNVMINCARSQRHVTLTTSVPDGLAIDIAGTQVRVEN